MMLKRFYRAMVLAIRGGNQKQREHYLKLMARYENRANELDRAAAKIRPSWA
jgi:hypothetical protein